jgi:protein-ribulosamine 3-kinase
MIPQEIPDSVDSYLSEAAGHPVHINTSSSLSGGCINHVHKIRTDFGDYCIKYNLTERFPGMFACEAGGLAAIKNTSEIRVPDVIHTGEAGPWSYLILEFINEGKKGPGFMREFGRSLARMHRHTSGYFGYGADNYMGSLPQSNRKHDDWNSFFAEERLGRQVSLAGRYFSFSDLAAFDRLYARLGKLIPDEPPSLLHGDLWGGNYMVSPDGKPCLIDPAVYYGHREADIAMTALFGGFDDSFYTSYEEEYPMEKGWQERIELFQLYPLLIHLNLFGGSYLESIVRIVRRF